MKFNILAIALFAVALGLLSACKDHCGHKGTCDDPLNINYPAAYIVNGGDGTLSVVNLNDFKVANEISLNGATFPHHVYLSPDKTTLAVAITSTDLSGGHGGHGGGTGGYKVQIIDATTGEIQHEIVTAHLPHNAVFNASGSELWVSQSAAAGHVLVFKTSDYSKIAEIATGKMPSEVTFSADGSTVFVANTDDGTVTMINPVTKAVLHTITVGNTPVGAWPGADGNMFVDNETDQTISVLTAATGAVTAMIPLGFKPGYAAYHFHHEELWVSDATNGKVAYYRLESGTWAKKGDIVTGADAHAITFSSDNLTAFVTNQGAGNVSVIDIENHTKTKDIAVGSKPNGIVLKQ
ncbi:MAG: YncE family protein [Saprospiraceae bacterium]